MAVGIDAQLVLQGLGKVAPEAAVAIFGERLEAPDQQGEARDDGELMGEVDNAELRNQGAVWFDDNIDSDTDKVGWSEVENSVEDGAADGTRDLQPIGFAVAEETRQ